MDIVCISLMILIGSVQKILSLISCYYCQNTQVEFCGNKTITCRYPADACYILSHANSTKTTKSCVWMGHCTQYFLCQEKHSCHLQCCYNENYCNREKTNDYSLRNTGHGDWIFLSVLYLLLFSILVAISRAPRHQ